MVKKYEAIKVVKYLGKKAITAEKAMELLGIPDDFSIEDAAKLTGERYVAAAKNNSTNRPYRKGIAKRYAGEILRNKWMVNGETITVDWDGKLISAQHRLMAIIIAEAMRLKNPDKYKRDYKVQDCTMEAIMIAGVDPKSADTADLGQKRTGADVIYRRKEFKGKITDREANKLSKTLAGALRLVWIREGGKQVSDAPHFPHSEMLDFNKLHPGIKQWVITVCENDGDKTEKHLSGKMSLGYLAGLCYLASYAKEDQDGGPAWEDRALEFLNILSYENYEGDDRFEANDKGMFKGHPIYELVQWIHRSNASGKTPPGRDHKCNVFVRAFNAWVDGTTLASKDFREKKDDPLDRMGGMDSELVELDEDDLVVDEPEGSEENVVVGTAM